MKGNRIVSVGRIENISIPNELPYAKALHVLTKDATGTGVTIDPMAFYSESTIELHNFVDSIIYRFIVDEDVPTLAYEITNRPHCIYREVGYDGRILRTWAWDAELGSFTSEDAKRRDARRRKVLGV